MIRTLQIGDVGYEIHEDARWCVSRWPDGTELTSVPNLDEESVARARSLGYQG